MDRIDRMHRVHGSHRIHRIQWDARTHWTEHRRCRLRRGSRVHHLIRLHSEYAVAVIVYILRYLVGGQSGGQCAFINAPPKRLELSLKLLILSFREATHRMAQELVDGDSAQRFGALRGGFLLLDESRNIERRVDLHQVFLDRLTFLEYGGRNERLLPLRKSDLS